MVLPSDRYRLLTFVYSDFNCQTFTSESDLQSPSQSFSCKGNVSGQLQTKFLKGNICQRKWANGEKTSQDCKRLPWVHTGWPAKVAPLKILSVRLWTNYRVPESAPLICMIILNSANFYKFCRRHKLRVLSDSKIQSFAPNSEFLSKTLFALTFSSEFKIWIRNYYRPNTTLLDPQGFGQALTR